MKKRCLFTLAGFLLGAACALIQGVTGADIMVTLMRPFTLLGNLLRKWSLSGAMGNALVWAVLIVLSFLPVLYILIARRKRKQSSDWLFLLTGAGIFGGLFLLINPTLPVHPALTEALSSSPEALTGGPVFAMLSLLLTSVVARWSGGLLRLKRQDQKLLFWTRALLTGSMMLIAFSVSFTAAENAQSVWGGAKVYHFQLMDVETSAAMGSDFSSDAFSAWAGSQVSDPMQDLLFPSNNADDASALIGFLLSCLLLIPDLFSICTLDSAVSLASSMSRGFFSEETDERASVLAVRARYTLIASVACMTARNVLTVLLGRWMLNSNVNFFLPLDGMLISCGAMLLARLLSAACRVKRDNDLMI